MGARQAPLLVPALALWLGAVAGPHLAVACVPGWCAVVGLAFAVRHRRVGQGVLFLGFGLVLGATARPSDAPGFPDPHRPVEVVAEVEESWRCEHGGATGPIRIRRIRQGSEVRIVSWRWWADLGPSVEAPRIGARLRLRGWAAPPRRYGNRRPVEVGRWRLRVEHPAFLVLDREPGAVALGLAAVRRLARDRLAAVDGPGGRLAEALVLGDASGLPARWRAGLRRNGLSHLLAVSGLHVGLVGGLAWLLAARLGGRRRSGAVLGAVFAYSSLVGPRPSVLRAATMAAILVATLGARRAPALLNALSGAVLLLVALDPLVVGEISFQLTVAATAGILLLAPGFQSRLRGLPAAVRLPLGVSLAAQLGTLPWALAALDRVSWPSPLWNLLLVPWTALVLATDLAWLALLLPAPGLAGLWAPVADALVAPYRFWAALPPASIWWSSVHLSPQRAVLVTAAIGIALGRRRGGATACWLLLALGIAWDSSTATRSGYSATFFDVGQGDSVLLRSHDTTVLIDGGGWVGGGFGDRVLRAALAGEGVGSLTAVVSSHPDADHCSGLADLLAEIPVQEVWVGPRWGESPCGRRLVAWTGKRLRVLWGGDRVELGDFEVDVLGPRAGERGKSNDRSLVLAVVAGGRRLLLTGDIGETSERALVRRLASEEGLHANLLKVPHHGSRFSSSPGFLAAVAPRLAVVSVGERNGYGHPAAESLERLRSSGAQVLRTDRHGQVTVRWGDGRGWKIELPAEHR